MARWIILALAVIILYKMVGNELRKRSAGKEKESAQEQARRKAAGNLVQDPVCGVYIDVESSNPTVRDGDTVYRFCSYECSDKFLQQLQQGGREIPAQTKQKDE